VFVVGRYRVFVVYLLCASFAMALCVTIVHIDNAILYRSLFTIFIFGIIPIIRSMLYTTSFSLCVYVSVCGHVCV